MKNSKFISCLVLLLLSVIVCATKYHDENRFLRYVLRGYEDEKDYYGEFDPDLNEETYQDEDDNNRAVRKDELKSFLYRLLNRRVDADADVFDETEESFSDKASPSCNVDPLFSFSDADTRRIIDSLNLMLTFWERNYDKIIVDGLFGVRMSEGSIKHAFQSMNPTHKFYESVKLLLNRTQVVATKIYHVLKNKNQTYAKNFLKILRKPFYFQNTWKNFDSSLVWKITMMEPMSEKKSDKCLHELFTSCKVSDRCLRMETVDGSFWYRLTHQALYFLLGESNWCHSAMVKALGGEQKLAKLYSKFGNNIYAQMIKEPIRGLRHRKYWDIVMEQAMICKSLGIVECARKDKVMPVLNWIEKEGCIYQKYFPGKIEKRYDSSIGRCSTHMTSVGMGHIASQLEFIINPPSCNLIS